jgi:hypothetical protein
MANQAEFLAATVGNHVAKGQKRQRKKANLTYISRISH